MIDTRPALLLVDDHTIVREGVKRILGSGTGPWAITEAASASQALECLRHGHFALAIVDLSMPGMSGLELIHRLKAEAPAMAVLVLSMHDEEQYAIRAFKAGATGYVTKDGAAAELATAVKKVAAGGVHVSPSLADRVVLWQLGGEIDTSTPGRLTDREREVLRRIVAGQRLTDIAAELQLSVKTVSTHKTNIQEKLSLPNMAALIRYGLEQGLGKTEPDSR